MSIRKAATHESLLMTGRGDLAATQNNRTRVCLPTVDVHDVRRIRRPRCARLCGCPGGAGCRCASAAASMVGVPRSIWGWVWAEPTPLKPTAIPATRSSPPCGSRCQTSRQRGLQPPQQKHDEDEDHQSSPPARPKPQLWLCGQLGNAPISSNPKTMWRMVPRLMGLLPARASWARRRSGWHHDHRCAVTGLAGAARGACVALSTIATRAAGTSGTASGSWRSWRARHGNRCRRRRRNGDHSRAVAG